MLEYSKWQRRHFFRTITTEESQLTNEIAEYAKRQLKDVIRFGAVYDTEVKEPLIQGCKSMTSRVASHGPGLRKILLNLQG